MQLTKSSSLPQIAPNYDKYDDFFSHTSKKKELAMQFPHSDAPDPEVELIMKTNKTSHQRNVEFIQKKSTLRSKVESYLTNSNKMGILDKPRPERKDRRSLNKLPIPNPRPLNSEAEQYSGYLNKLKSQLNFYSQKNRRMQSSIKNSKAMTNQIKQKIIFYQQELAKSITARSDLLSERQQNLLYIHFESDRLRHVKDRLKEMNIYMKLKIKGSQNKLKSVQNQNKKLNQVQGIGQTELDNKKYLLKKYQEYQFHKSEKAKIETSIAIRDVEENEASSILKYHQDKISIMDHVDYRNQICQRNHSKYMRELVVHKFYEKMLESIASQYHDYYDSYQKAEQLIKMHSMDRNNLVQNSYKKSFQVKVDLQLKIKEREDVLKAIESRKRQLQTHYRMHYLNENEDIEKRLSRIKKQFVTGKELEKTANKKEEEQFYRSVCNREEEAGRCKQLLVRLKQWTIKQEQNLNLSISKNQPLTTHLEKIIDFLGKEMKLREHDFDIAKLNLGSLQENSKNQKKGLSRKTK